MFDLSSFRGTTPDTAFLERRYETYRSDDGNDTRSSVARQIPVTSFFMARQRQHSATAKGLIAAPPAGAGQARGERVRQVILDAAIELIFDMGFRAERRSHCRRDRRRQDNHLPALAEQGGTGDGGIHAAGRRRDAVSPAPTIMESVRLQMRILARVFRGRDGALIKSLLAEAQFDPELATAFRERWTLPRRRVGDRGFQASQPTRGIAFRHRPRSHDRPALCAILLPPAK